MANRAYFKLFIVATACSMLAACSSIINMEPKPVTFQLSISPDGFSQDAELQINLWTAAQIKASETQANCAISQDASGVETIQCPEGVEYQAINPETFTYPISSLSQPLFISSQSIHVGENYLLQASGLSQDNCNDASARLEGTARSETVVIENLDWLTTEMACP